jgi:hypothetical protein
LPVTVSVSVPDAVPLVLAEVPTTKYCPFVLVMVIVWPVLKVVVVRLPPPMPPRSPPN